MNTLALKKKKENKMSIVPPSPLKNTTFSTISKYTSKPAKSPFYLPFQKENCVPVPNVFLRSALFSVLKKGRRAFLENKKISSVKDIEILYTGLQLDQFDLDVWEQVLILSRKNSIGTFISFSPYSFLKTLGKKNGQTQQKSLFASLKRLNTAQVQIEYTNDGIRKYYIGNMIHEIFIEENIKGTKQIFKTIKLRLNNNIASLYCRNSWTALQWQQRLALKEKSFTKWLHGFYSTHKKPVAYKISTLFELSGSSIDSPYKRKQVLIEALKELCFVTKWGWEIKDEKVYIHKGTQLVFPS